MTREGQNEVSAEAASGGGAATALTRSQPSSRRFQRTARRAVMAAALAVVAGCGQSGGGVPDPSDGDMLRGVVTTYRMASQQLRRPPKSMDELAELLAPVANDPSEFLRSKRDGEEFVVVWGINVYNAPGDTVVAYERTGVDGKRMAVTLMGETREYTAEEIAEIEAKGRG